MRAVVPAMAAVFALASVAAAQHPDHAPAALSGNTAAPDHSGHEAMPGMQRTPGAMPGMSHPGAMPGMNHGDMHMSSSIDLNDAMNREGSGTSWLPDSTPMYGKMIMRQQDMLMLHGAITPRYVHSGSDRGDEQVSAPNWFMGMYSHPLAENSQIGFRAMLSLDPVLVGGAGYPLLFQTGETWKGQALHDHQHPHDFFSELSATYSRRLGAGGNSAYLYLGYPGEPALGPPTFMHRLIAYDLPDAPIGHHWQDATHITFGVATLGLNFGSRVKIEGSVFTGREPDENRWDFDRPRFDSHSGRISFNPDRNNALQISHGFIKGPETLDPDVNARRTTASWIYNRPLRGDANLTTTLVWGQNDLSGEGKTNSYLAEAHYTRGDDSVFARLENIQKSGHELVLPEALHDRKFTVGAYTIGYMRDLLHRDGIDTGIGAAITLHTKPSSLDPFYGRDSTPVSFQVMLRMRPSRMPDM